MSGLRTKFCRSHHRKDVLVTVSWLDLETPNELVYHLFSHFGKVTGSITDCVYKKSENDSSLASLLDGIPNGERQFWMNVTSPLPSYGIIDGKRVRYSMWDRIELALVVIRRDTNVPAKQTRDSVRLEEETRQTWRISGDRPSRMLITLSGLEVKLTARKILRAAWRKRWRRSVTTTTTTTRGWSSTTSCQR